MIQDSERLLLTKCAKCQNITDNDTQNQQPLCKHCRQLEQSMEDSLISSGYFHTKCHPETPQNELRPSLPILNKFNSLPSLDENSQLKKKERIMSIRNYHSLMAEVGEDSDSEEERLIFQEKKLKQIVRKNKLKLKAQKKVIIGSGFTFDMTDFFKFKKKELGVQQQQNIFETISGSRLAWIILLYTMCSTAFIPSWIMSIKATKLLRQQYRFFMQALMMLPFVFYEKRTIDPQKAQKYTLKYIFSPQNIIKPYISSFTSSLWFLLVLTSGQWTYVSHCIVLGGLSNFFLSIGRSLNKKSHDLQSGGQVFVLLGILLLIYDSISLKSSSVSSDQLTYMSTTYLQRTWWERVGGDLMAIIASFYMAQSSKYTSDLSSYYPPFLSLLIVNSFNVINLTLMGFFFNGATFDFDPFWGIFSVFTDSHFTSFMYLAIILAFGQLLSYFIITKMFPEPIIPALAMTLQPLLACFFLDVNHLQSLPGSFGIIGCVMILPGMMLVLIGQCFFERRKQSKQESDQKVKKLMDLINQLKEKKVQRETYVQARRQAGMSNKLSQTHYVSKKVHF